MLLSRVNKIVQLMTAIKKLKDPQSEMLLLRNCTSVSRLYFSLHTTNPAALQQATEIFGDHLLKYLRLLITGDGSGFGPLQQRLATLPIKYGGFGIYIMEDTQAYCYIASQCQTASVQKAILGDLFPTNKGHAYKLALQNFIQVCGLPSSYCVDDTAPPSMHSLGVAYFDAIKKKISGQFSLSARDSILWQCNQVKHAQDYLLANPISGLNQCLGPRQFRAVLCYRLGIPLFVENSSCSSCNKPMDIYGDHALHCAKDVGVKFRHDFVCDIVADICYKASVLARKEVSLGLLSDDDKDLRPADILVLNWKNGKDVCMDVTGVSPFTGEGIRSFVPGKAISNVVARKCIKYLDKCVSLGYGLGVLAFSTLGELGEDTLCFFKRLKNCLVSNDASSGVGSFIFHRLDIAIQKGVGAQLVARLPTKSM
ncbi:uncharacterized protein LOC113357083 [Papaver somniferum]|uniref:uncharacterized protein LOC113357083 n=1 Tax=Papaver somniferum TaxID=3469 RepID=UPI000E6FC1B7|nr:uncharacterized protein LOC113357083 [Papaver somniferum]